MNPEPMLVDWIERADHDAPPGWEPDPPRAEQRYDARLGARLAEISRQLRDARRRFVAGCPVIQHPCGQPIAAASGSAWLAVRSDLPAGALRPIESPAAPLGPGWVELDPWAPDTAFARAVDLLRGHITRAYERAEPGA